MSSITLGGTDLSSYITGPVTVSGYYDNSFTWQGNSTGGNHMGGDICHLCGSVIQFRQTVRDEVYGKRGQLKSDEASTIHTYRCRTQVVRETIDGAFKWKVLQKGENCI